MPLQLSFAFVERSHAEHLEANVALYTDLSLWSADDFIEDVESFVSPDEADDVNVLACGDVSLIVGWIYFTVPPSLAIPEESNLNGSKLSWRRGNRTTHRGKPVARDGFIAVFDEIVSAGNGAEVDFGRPFARP